MAKIKKKLTRATRGQVTEQFRSLTDEALMRIALAPSDPRTRVARNELRRRDKTVTFGDDAHG